MVVEFEDYKKARAKQQDSIFIPARVKVFGVGGGGGNVIERMIQDGDHNVEYIIANTDAAVVETSNADKKLIIGAKATKGQGAGMIPAVGREAAIESADEIKAALAGADMVFIAAGLGGGTGTGAAPVVAEYAKELDILTVAVVTEPFKFEGKKRAKLAKEGLENLQSRVDTIMVIPNNRLLEVAKAHTTVSEAFNMADDVLKEAISGLADLINNKGVINLDFADVRTVMKNKGKAIIGIGLGEGDKRGLIAAQKAIQSPLLDNSQIKGATGVVINIMADENFTLIDAQNAAEYIEDYADEDADVIFGLYYDKEKKDQVEIMVIAAGFNSEPTESIESDNRKALRVQNSVDKHNSLNNSDSKSSESQEVKAEENPPVKKTESEELILGAEHISRIEDSPYYPEGKDKKADPKNDGPDKNDPTVPSYLRK